MLLVEKAWIPDFVPDKLADVIYYLMNPPWWWSRWAAANNLEHWYQEIILLNYQNSFKKNKKLNLCLKRLLCEILRISVTFLLLKQKE